MWGSWWKVSLRKFLLCRNFLGSPSEFRALTNLFLVVLVNCRVDLLISHVRGDIFARTKALNLSKEQGVPLINPVASKSVSSWAKSFTQPTCTSFPIPAHEVFKRECELKPTSRKGMLGLLSHAFFPSLLMFLSNDWVNTKIVLRERWKNAFHRLIAPHLCTLLRLH